MKKHSKDIVYLVGDFRAATVFVGKGLFYSAAEKPEDLAKPVHDVDLNGLLLQVENDGMIAAKHYPELVRTLD